MHFSSILTVFANESGATAIEYGLIIALVSVGLVVALDGVTDSLTATFRAATSSLN